ncbi:putative G2/mitotic-specific cyclin-A [Blattamonas nauphoetae]|uniref:G2/mitotic-specific cyclin-A n=1 Tax=Blattamonas nauphoetae TaxID=2049346 RepID=A0ABQ9XYR2_9EUKA|nr:putative G2/mitotic-specific cyclin-A [Blattamonas nauphoetae]
MTSMIQAAEEPILEKNRQSDDIIPQQPETSITSLSFEEFSRQLSENDILGLYPYSAASINYSLNNLDGPLETPDSPYLYCLMQKKTTKFTELQQLSSTEDKGQFVQPLYLEPESTNGKVLNIDGSEDEDTDGISPYANIVFYNMFKSERKHRPLYDYFSLIQNGSINWLMRAVLIEWILDVIRELGLTMSTFFLAIDYTDRFLSSVRIKEKHLQVLGLCSLFLAGKIDEVVFHKTAEDFVWMSEETVTKAELLKMEEYLLTSLQFHLIVPTPFSFAPRFLKADQNSNRTIEYLLEYYLHLSALCPETLRFLPSTIAASCLFLAHFAENYTNNKTIDDWEELWTPTLQFYTNHSLSSLTSCIFSLHNFIVNVYPRHRAQLPSIYSSYANPAKGRVSSLFSLPRTLPRAFTDGPHDDDARSSVFIIPLQCLNEIHAAL